ncbi:DUF5305 family protein [Haloferax sulfurifontis]|uniref:DUF5305 domain-containing protein n=1 Tax=Haloferax sulfurifontis ATCC BAA-897 TaxID=662480 RepID=M0ISJ7_9EURY|nr:DUF5305 family protein [Haloferax sulfurifontis]ELZ98449.1 hypothetical protein C441_01184 [Haloferax sulfurifontis ATCC BAA-897]
MSETNLRRRAFLDKWQTVLIIGFVVLTVVGGWTTYTTHVSPPVQTQEAVVDSWTSSGDFSHTAIVTNSSTLYDNGTVLENRSVYFPHIIDDIGQTFTYRYRDATEGDVDVEMNAFIRLNQTGRVEQGRIEYWSQTESLGEKRVTSLNPGESAQLRFPFDVNETARHAARVQDDLGTAPGRVEATIIVRTHVSGTVDGKRVDETIDYKLFGEYPGDKTFRITGETPPKQFDFVGTIETEPQRGLLRRVGSVALLAFGGLGLLSVAVGRLMRFPPLTASERDRLDSIEKRAANDEWISRGRIPETIRENPVIEVETLDGLVDVAVDSNSRVIEDDVCGGFHVVDGDIIYSHVPEQPHAGAGEDVDDADDDDTEEADSGP